MDFNNIPNGWKLPLVSIEVDPSQAGTPTQTLYALLSDYKIAASTAVADVPIAVGSVADAKALFGVGSPLARMYERFFAVNRGTPVFCLPITPPSSGVAATGSLSVTQAASIAGTLSLYVAGQKVDVGVLSSDTAAQVATKIIAAINAATSLPVTALVDGTNTFQVNLTAKWKGLTGNDIRVEANYLGANGGEALPTGLTLTFPTNNALSGGTGTPDWTNAIANIGDDAYEYVAIGHSDSGSMLAWGNEYGFGDTGRWGWMRQTYGHVITARRDIYSSLMSWGPTNNSGVITVEAFEPTAPSPVWEVAATFCARAARALANDPARPLQTLTQDGILPAPRHDRFNKTERNALAGVGLAIQSVNASGLMMIEREQTTYQKNSLGQADNAYELMTTLATLAALFRRLTQAITNKYPRSKLANDGTRFGPGQAIVTPNTIRAELVAEYRGAEYDGLVENVTAFKNALIVERDANDPNRLNVLYPPDLVNQLRMFAVLAQFRLQFPTIDPNA